MIIKRIIMIIKKKITALILSVLILLTSISPITVFAEQQDILAQYTGSTTASYGFKPDCTFTINKIVDDKFRGTCFTHSVQFKLLRI